MSSPAPIVPPPIPPTPTSAPVAAPPTVSSSQLAGGAGGKGGACGKCGYDLRGLEGTAEVCPECGTPVPAVLRGGRGACIRCIYPLTGLPDGGDCPECGTPVRLSRYDVLIGSAGVRHVERLQLGVLLILAGQASMMALWILLFIVGALEDIAAPVRPFMAVVPFAMVLVGIMNKVGWWLFTAPDRRNIERETASRSRGTIRTLILLQVTFVLLCFVTAFIAGLSGSGAMLLAVFLLPFVTLPVIIITGAIHFFASIAYIKWLAARLPSEAVARRAGLVVWLAPVLATVGALVVIGPLIAVAFYWNLLDMVRRQLKVVHAGVAGP